MEVDIGASATWPRGFNEHGETMFPSHLEMGPLDQGCSED